MILPAMCPLQVLRPKFVNTYSPFHAFYMPRPSTVPDLIIIIIIIIIIIHG
jgi:hypothetical protein